jgi:chromosome segregation protein
MKTTEELNEMKIRYQESLQEVEYQVKELNSNMRLIRDDLEDGISELESQVEELKEELEKKIDNLEQKYNNSSEIKSLKSDLEDWILGLESQIESLRCDLEDKIDELEDKSEDAQTKLNLINETLNHILIEEKEKVQSDMNFGMFSHEGNVKCGQVIEKLKNIIYGELFITENEFNEILKHEIGIVATEFPEVNDTEPREIMIEEINKMLKDRGYSYTIPYI